MTTLINYTLPGNITSFPQAIGYMNQIMSQTTLGWSDFFGPFALGLCFIAFYAVSSRYTAERSLAYSVFMTTIAAALLSSAALLNPVFVFYCVIILAGVIYFGGIE